MNIQELYKLYQECTGVTTDTRKIEKGNIFFALKGERFNGNEFAEQAIQSGAAYVVIDEAKYAIDERCVLVENVLVTLQNIACFHRQQLNIPIIGITGTNGKTTTKELIYSVLSQKYKTHYTLGNFNNHIGVPLTLLAMPLDIEMAIIEMGANHKGEIATLCNIAKPSHGLVTNVGKAHLEGFGNFEGVIATKSELYQYLAIHDGIAFVNADESHLAKMAQDCKRVQFYDREKLSLQLSQNTPFLELQWRGEVFQTQLIGNYNFPNVMTAIQIGEYFQVEKNDIIKGLTSYTPKNNRSQWIQKATNHIILDAYNANPTSMTVALENLAAIKAERKIAILGDMLELGVDSKQEHERIVMLSQKLELELVTIGEIFENVHQGKAYVDIQSLKKEWNWNHYQNTTFLLKGSRGIRIEKILEE